MSSMKPIMESWRGYVDYVDSESILKDRSYLTDVLGISLPITENEHVFLSESKKAEILQEKMLHENFLKSLFPQG